MESSLMGILLSGFQVIFSYLNFKILFGKKFKINELALLLIGAAILGNSYSFLGMYGVFAMLLFLLIMGHYFIDEKFLYIAGVLSYSIIIMIICDHISSLLNIDFWKISDVMEGTRSAIFQIFISAFLSLCTSISIIKLKVKLEKKLPFIHEFRPVISTIGIYTAVIYYMSIFLGKYLGNNTEIITLNLVFFIIYFFISILTFFMYASSTRNKYEAQQKELEYLANQRYMESMENQFQEISKFRHDYKNILMSMENYITEKDIEGLDSYYHSVVKTSSEIMEQNNFKLEKLGKIHVRELKSIVASKLITAQEKGLDTKVEVTEIIEKVNMDPVALVRVLGIFLDNAVEELELIGKGLLSVAVYQDEKAVHLIIQNDCREDVPKVHKLKAKGFSTKGENRGTGLSNVQEIVSKAENLCLSTTIVDQIFTQKLVIEF